MGKRAVPGNGGVETICLALQGLHLLPDRVHPALLVYLNSNISCSTSLPEQQYILLYWHT